LLGPMYVITDKVKAYQTSLRMRLGYIHKVTGMRIVLEGHFG